MEEMQTFFNANKENLKRLLVTERIKKGYGALFIHIQRNKDDTPQQIKTYYLPMISTPKKIREDLIKKYHDNNSNSSKIFFILYDKDKSIIIEDNM